MTKVWGFQAYLKKKNCESYIWSECYSLNIVPFPHSYVEILILSVIVLGCVAFGRCSDHESKTLVNGISAFIKRGLILRLFYHIRAQWEVCNLKDSLHENTTMLFPDFSLPATRIMRNKFLFIHHPVWGILVYPPELTKTVSSWSLVLAHWPKYFL